MDLSSISERHPVPYAVEPPPTWRYSAPRAKSSGVFRAVCELSDLELLERVAQRDQAALATLYDRWAAKMLGVIRRFLRDPALAEDVLQQTFLEVWLKASSFAPERGRPELWISLIARSRALDALRKRREAQPVEPLDWIGEQAGADLMEQRETGAALEAALDRLPVDQSRAIRLAFFDGWTHEQIAQHLTLPLGTVKTRIRLGMKRLGQLLTQGRTGVFP